MTKKQLKRLAKEMADYEYTIQTSTDPDKVNRAKNSISHLIESSELELDDMILLDEMIQALLQEKI